MYNNREKLQKQLQRKIVTLEEAIKRRNSFLGMYMQ